MPRRAPAFLVGLILVSLLAFAGKSSGPVGPSPLKVREGKLVKFLTFTGEIRAKRSVTLLSPDIRDLWTYTISFLAPDGSYVKPGDLVVQFDASELEVKRLDTEKKREEARIAIAQKEADIESRRQDLSLNLALAQKNFKVAQLNASVDPSLLPRSKAEQYQLEQSKAKLELDKATERLANLEKGSKAELDVVRLDYEQADLDLKRLQSDLGKMTIPAPTQGLVLCNENWQSGRKFQKGDAIWDGFPLVSLPDLAEVQVMAYVHNQDFPRLREGATAEVVLDSIPGRVFPAVIAGLPQAATPYRNRSELKVFRVYFDVLEKETSAFKPGMTARVRVPVETGSGLLVPRRAIAAATRDQAAVLLKAGNRRVPVKILQANEEEVLVKGDIRAGDELLVGSHAGSTKRRSDEDWITLRKEDLTFGVSGSGQLQAAQALEIRPPNLRDFHRFKIASMVEEGKQVTKGEPILDFDKTEISKRLTDENANLAKVKEERGKTQASLEVQRKDLELQVEEAKVEKEKAVNKLTEAREFESNLKLKTAEYEAEYATRKVDMLEKKLGAVNRHADLQLKILDDRIAFYSNRVKLANDAIEALSIKAPTSGVVIYKPNWNNEKKQVGSDCWSMETIMTLPDLNTLLIEGQVAEVDAGKVHMGQRVSVTLDAIPEKTFDGKVTEVSTIFTEASFDRPVKVLQIKAKLESLDLKRMRPGMVARLELIVDRLRNVLAIPLSVIEVEDGKSFVKVKKGDKTERRMVQLGKNNGIVAVVASGLAEGEQVAGKPAETSAAPKSTGG